MDASRIKILVMDVDGTLTDGKIYMGADGEVMKAFDVKDGYTIANMLPEMGIVPVVITGRKSAIVERRCAELGITHLYQGVSDKLETLTRILEAEGLGLADVAYIGDDLNDLDCMRTIAEGGGVTACPADATEAVRAISDHVIECAGGDGVIRRFVEQVQDTVDWRLGLMETNAEDF